MPARIATVSALALLVGLLLGASAEAAVVQGKGELRAAGHGFALVELRGVATVAGRGVVIVEHRAIVEKEGFRRVTPLNDGRVLLEGTGMVRVRSFRDRTRLEAAGARLRLRARGIGVAVLDGVGHYSTEDQEGRWGPDLELSFESEE
jgi:hypothetical protein